MNKRLAVIVSTAVVAGSLLLAVPVLAERGGNALPDCTPRTTVPGRQPGRAPGLEGMPSARGAQSKAIDPAAVAKLTADEQAGLLYMREEEKLAHDVYTALFEAWDAPLFANIARAEQQHTEAVLRVMTAAGIADPAATLEAGKFSNAELQALYDKLVAQGNSSLEAALKAGAAIEELDILDLQEALADTSNTVLQNLYANLQRGSENHLRAFASNLERQTGEAYVPQHLTQDAYDAIVSAPGIHGGRGAAVGGARGGAWGSARGGRGMGSRGRR